MALNSFLNTSPKLSIITINYNNAQGLKKTIESVVQQTFAAFEYIIIDGGSTDESVEVIKQFAPKLNYWVSEEDNGIYHAMNKGTRIAKGEYLLFLNSGDFLFDNHVLETVIPYLSATDIVYGDMQVHDSKKRLSFPGRLSFDYFRNNYLPHQASFIKAKLLQKLGLYNEAARFGGDWEFFILALCKYSATYKHLNLIVCIFDMTGISTVASNYEFIKKERQHIINEHFTMFEQDYKLLDNFKILQYSRLFKIFQKIGFFKFIDFPKSNLDTSN